MLVEKNFQPKNGFLALFVALAYAIGISIIVIYGDAESNIALWSLIPFLLFLIIAPGFKIVFPNEATALLFFGKYVGTIRENGFFWTNPLYGSKKVTLRARNLNGEKLKVNDGVGDPIEIAAVLVWRVENTFKALFEVDDYVSYVRVQSEAAVRALANKYPYDKFEDETANLTLLSGADKVNDELENALHERLNLAGIQIIEARISHLAYSPEIAGAMLQRQQAIAIVAARSKNRWRGCRHSRSLCEKIEEGRIIEMDDHTKAAMVSNLMVVLCSDRAAQPVLNTGTLNH